MCECLETQYEMTGIYIIDSRKVMVIMSSPGKKTSCEMYTGLKNEIHTDLKTKSMENIIRSYE